MGEFRLIWNTTFNNKLLKPQKPFSKFEAWVWMLMETCIKEKGDNIPRNFGGKERMIQIKYGEFCHSERFMSEAWGWSRQRVSTFLKHLSSTLDPMIAQKVSQQISVISVCNFWDYQNPKKAKQASSKPAASQQQASSKPNLNNRTSKQINNKEKDMFRTTEENVVQEPTNGRLKKFSDFDWSKDIVEIVGKYATLALVINDTTKNVEFWDGHIDIMSDYFPTDSEMKRWFNQTMFEINRWQTDNPHRASKSSKGLRQRISTWLSKEYQKLEVTKR